MKIEELEIINIRGIKQLKISPKSKSIVVWGPNGSGKSAVVDAIDFLLSGRITRLTGKGTGGITLNRHGPHIDHVPEEAFVRALVKFPGSNITYEISRFMSSPLKLECEENIKSKMASVEELARRSQHVLSRREILKYITSEAGSRAEEIQNLLNISDVEAIRKNFVSLRNKTESNLQSSKRSVENAKKTVATTLELETFDEAQLLTLINLKRAVLGGDNIQKLVSSVLKKDIKLPKSIAGSQSINLTLLEQDIRGVKNNLSPESQEAISRADALLRTTIQQLNLDESLLRSLSSLELFELGLRMLGNNGDCPLCGTVWPEGELKAILVEKISKGTDAANLQSTINKNSEFLTNRLVSILTNLKRILNTIEAASIKQQIPVFRDWISRLENYAVKLENPIQKYLGEVGDESIVEQLMAPDGIIDILDYVSRNIESAYPESTPEQTAWDTLTRLEENLRQLETARKDMNRDTVIANRAHILLHEYLSARDEVLGNLFEEISGRFAELYKGLHGDDEDGFTALLRPEDAGMNFEVEFYGRGKHPPHALHSEGHQDSMGLCLYLALEERLTSGVIDLTILDDVVMSVDSDHRRQVCKLLSKEFPNRQFLITTHDKTWANQMKSEGLVSSKDIVEFYNWNLDTGPYINIEDDLWLRIRDFLKENNVPSAAGLLRKGSEEFFSYACDLLEAPVKYRIDGRNDLGDFLPSAIATLRSNVKKAKKAAQSWSDREAFEALQEFDSLIGPINSRTQAEQWALNANVHFNSWANFSKNDFLPVLEAFQDLFGLFVCQKCNSVLRVVKQGFIPSGIRCNCGKINWNLIEKG